MSSPFKQEAKKLYEAGYSVLPLQPEGKGAIPKEWTQYCATKMPISEIKKYMERDDLNIGVALGTCSNLVALDYDNDIDGIHAKIQAMVPESPVVKVGKKGFTAFYRYNGEKNHSWKKDKQTVVELLSHGRQTVVPPSIHPDGGAYEYTTLEELGDVKAEDLPVLPSDFSDKMDNLFGLDKGRGDDYEPLDISLEDLQAALEYVSSEDYETWIQMGMAIKSAYPDDDGFQVWDEWSKTSDKYEPKEMPAKWKSFRRDGISVGTILYLAMQNGYECRFTSDELKQDTMQYFVTLDQVEDEVDNWKRVGRYHGVPCGIAGLDDLLKFRKGESTILSGYGNAGKSELLDNIAVGLMKSEENWRFAICSMEKNPSSHYDNLIQIFVGKPREEMTVEEYREAKAFIRDRVVMVNGKSLNRNFDRILVQLDRVMKFKKIDAIILDPFNYLVTKYQVQNPMQHTRNILIGLQEFAEEKGIHSFMVAHPTKPDKSFGKLPRLTKYSIAGSADFVNVPDNIVIVTRGKNNTANILVDKVRDQEVDKLGEIDLKYDKKTKSYKPFDDILDDEEF